MSFVTGYTGNFNWAQVVTILDGDTDSDAIDCGGFALCGILIPAALDGSALAFLVSDAIDGTFVPLVATDSGTAVSYTVAASTFAAIDPKDFQGVRFLKIQSGSSESADRVFKCALKGF